MVVVFINKKLFKNEVYNSHLIILTMTQNSNYFDSCIQSDRNLKNSIDLIVLGKFIDHREETYSKHMPGELENSLINKSPIPIYSDLFTYNRSTGVASIYSTDGRGNLSLVKEHTEWSTKKWDSIVPGKFSSNSYSDLFTYNRSTGVASIYSTDGRGNLSLVKEHTEWSTKKWDSIVPGKFSSNSYSDLFTYNRSTGVASIYSTDGRGNLSLVKEHTEWSTKKWDSIVPGKFSSNSYSDLFTYNRSTGVASIYSTDGIGNLSLVKEHTEWSTKKWDSIVPGYMRNYNTIYSDLFTYNRSTGVASIYSTDGRGNLSLVKEHTEWSTKKWDIILCSKLALNINHEVIFVYNIFTGTSALYSYYIPRALQYKIDPTVIQKGRSIKINLYFLDEGNNFRVELRSPENILKESYESIASGTYKEHYSFNIKNSDDYSAGIWKVLFFIKEGNEYYLKHIEKFSVVEFNDNI